VRNVVANTLVEFQGAVLTPDLASLLGHAAVCRQLPLLHWKNKTIDIGH
jgi:hypothetical protein